jgi:CheY-like chemotaxis protein
MTHDLVYVEEYLVVKDITVSLLKHQGYSVASLQDGNELITYFEHIFTRTVYNGEKQSKLPIVITEQNLKHVNGVEAGRCIRELFPDIKMILISVNDIESLSVEEAECFDKILTKPFMFEELHDCIKSLDV